MCTKTVEGYHIRIIANTDDFRIIFENSHDII